jgi:hypothetical protein
MPPLLSLSTPSLLATSLTNLSSSRHRSPSLAAQREEGWTEVWGGKDYNNNKNENDESTVEEEDAPSNKPYLPPRYIHVLNDDCDYIGATTTSSTANNNGRTLLTLTQYRVAWYEQIILRMCQIPHTVENSSYAARECTGALPCLLDLNCGQVVVATAAESEIDNHRNDDNIPLVVWGNTWNSYLSRLNKPVYIGRNQPGGLGSYFFHQCQSKRKTNTTDNNGDDDDLYPSWFMSSGSHIVDYLRMKHSSSMKHRVLFPEHLRQQQQQPPPLPNNSNSSGDDAMAYETLIQDKLNYILLALRYGNDPAWEGVYKEQCIRASLDPNNYSSPLMQKQPLRQRKSRRTFFSLWSWYQAYSERALALYNLIPSKYATTTMGCCSASMALDLFRYNDYRYGDRKGGSSLEEEDDTVGGGDTGATTTTETAVHHHHHHQHHPFSSMVPSYGGVGGGDSGSVNVYRAMEYADMYYTSLEQKMVVGGGGGGSATYFLGTSIPSYIDALLFSHLAEALCDVYLVLVLAKHSRLMKYFQWMYDQYFGEKYVGGGADAEWVKWNNVSNSLNAFNQIPEATSLRKSGFGGQEVDGNGGMTHAINLMQELAIHCHELDEAMRDAAALRLKGGRERLVLEKQHRPIGSTLYQWLMGVEVKLWGSSRQKSQLSSADAGKSKTNDNSGEEEEDEEGDSESAKKAMWQKHMEQVKRDRRYSDEVWISGVVVTFVGALLLSYSKSKK